MREVMQADAGADHVDNVDELRFPRGTEEPPSPQALHCLGELLSDSPRLQLLYDLLARRPRAAHASAPPGPRWPMRQVDSG
jgi:hypothetical protein